MQKNVNKCLALGPQIYFSHFSTSLQYLLKYLRKGLIFLTQPFLVPCSTQLRIIRKNNCL